MLLRPMDLIPWGRLALALGCVAAAVGLACWAVMR